MVHKMLLAVVAVVLAVPATAQDQPQSGEKPAVKENLNSGQAKTAMPTSDLPFKGTSTADVNVRYAPKTDSNVSSIAAILKAGEEVTVVDAEGDFYQILPPRGAGVWIFARNVKKEADNTGVVVGNEVPVRLDSRNNAEKVATLEEGAQVKILKEHLGWYQIAAPETVKYFVAKKYIKYVGKADGRGGKNERVADGGDAKLREAENLEAEQRAFIDSRQISKLDFGKLAAAFEAAAAAAKSADVKSMAEAKANRYRDIEKKWPDIRQKIDAIERVRDLVDGKEQPRWDFCGHVDTVGNLVDRPGTHKLVLGGKIVCFLRARDNNQDMERRMNMLYEKYVGVKGTVLPNPPGWEGYVVVYIDSIEEIGQ